MPLLKVDNINIHYELDGEGPEVMVLVNGLGDELGTWSEQMDDFLTAGYRILRIDNRGVGASDKPDGPYTTQEMADDIKAVVDHIGLSRFHMVGVSMGGMIAQAYALAYPGDLKSVTLACTYAAPGPFCTHLFKFWEDLAPLKGVPFVMQEVTLWAFTQEFFHQRPDDLKAVEDGMAAFDMPLEAYLAQLSSICTHDTRARLSEINVPTLTLAGTEDILIPVHLSRELHEGLPQSTWAEVPGGHGCMWERPSEFNAAILAFVEKQ